MKNGTASLAAVIFVFGCASPSWTWASGYGLNFTNMGQWVSFAALLNDSGSPIESFKTTWIVPQPPASDEGQILYFWNGIEPIDHSAVLQPVLQWGITPIGGGSYWAIASWWVSADGSSKTSSLVPVHPGDVLTGTITLLSQQNGQFTYRSEFDGIPETRLEIQSGSELVLGVEALEAYYANQCSDYTDNMSFTNIQLKTSAAENRLQWHAFDHFTECGQNAVVDDNSTAGGSVSIHTH